VLTLEGPPQGSEAPSEMMFYFPDKKALCLAEVLTKHMHKVYTIRGAKMRDALAWSRAWAFSWSSAI
jgi:alkyl sulfatase BDS1-like metallo-beta-lactamase superfamily hydrolase